MEKCWASHWELQKEAILVLMKDQGWFYHLDPLGLLSLETFRVQVLERVIHWVITKELGLEINKTYLMVKV